MTFVYMLITSSVLLILAGPAFADCNQEVQRLKAAVTQAETGATTATTGLPATPHQEEVLAGQKGKQGESTGPSGPGQAVVPVSPHQQQVLRETQGNRPEPADLLAEARDMAKAGDEQGCMQKVTQVKGLLGIH